MRAIVEELNVTQYTDRAINIDQVFHCFLMLVCIVIYHCRRRMRNRLPGLHHNHIFDRSVGMRLLCLGHILVHRFDYSTPQISDAEHICGKTIYKHINRKHTMAMKSFYIKYNALTCYKSNSN